MNSLLKSCAIVCSAEQTDERAPSAGAKSLCIPFDQERYGKIVPGETKCPACGSDAKRWTMFGRSYVSQVYWLHLGNTLTLPPLTFL